MNCKAARKKNSKSDIYSESVNLELLTYWIAIQILSGPNFVCDFQPQLY